MRKIANILLNLDRRIIFLLIAAAVLVPLLRPFNLPGISISQPVKGVYDKIESLAPGDVLFISMDFDPTAKPELYPMGISILRHAFSKDLRVICMTLWAPGVGMAEEVMSKVAREYHKEYGKDYAFLGWMPGQLTVIIGLGQDLKKTFPKDFYGNKTDRLQIFENINSLRDIDYMVDLAAGDPGIETWYLYGKEKYGFELGGGCTAVIAPGLYPFLQTGQINGLIGGMRGAAEYETLLNRKDKATVGMDVLSTTHFLIIGLVILSNIFYLITRKGKTVR
ncbi:MAG: hypothetical protein QME40_02395 [bacterium]|nr:hypothetical protein [bacterium]